MTYNSSALRSASAFNFTGSIIATANVLPRTNPAFEAVLSRVGTFELDASNAEVIELMKKLACNGYGDELSATEYLEIVNFISEFASTRELSLRLLEPSFKNDS